MVTVQVEGSRNPGLEKKLNERGLDWEFKSGVPLAEINFEASLKNQVRLDEPINQETVDRYRVALGRGTVFPAILTAPSRAVEGLVAFDGNHRLAAYKSNGRKGIDLYVVRNASEQAMLQLATEANLEHGLPTSKADRLHAALYLIDGGMSQRDAANLLNLTESDVSIAVTVHKAGQRADELGILRSRWDKLPTAIQRRLEGVSTDEGFEALTKLAMEAHLKANEVEDAVRSMKDIRSSSGQRMYVESLREAYSERLSVAGGGKARRGKQGFPPRALLAAGLGQIRALPAPKMVTSLMPAEVKADFAQQIAAAIDTLQQFQKELQA